VKPVARRHLVCGEMVDLARRLTDR
jgi:hypothetical protein